MRLPVLSSVLAVLLVLSGCGGGSSPLTVSVTPSAAQAIDFGQSVNLTAAVANDSKSGGVTWTLSGPGALTNQSATGATYVAPSAAPGGVAKITAASVTQPTVMASVNITVTAPPSITTTSLPAGTEGTAYSQSVAVTGGAGALTYSLSVGTLPAGLSLNASSGAITGTPTGPNSTSNFTVKATDASAAGTQSATQALSIAINLPPAPAITTTTLPAVVEGTAYSQTIATTGGLSPLTFSLSVGTLPAGLSLNASTGAITGTPTGPNGTANFTVQVADHSNPVQTATQPLSILVSLPPPPAISTTSLPAGVEGSAYSQTLAATGHGTLAYSVSLGTLPAGLSLNSGTGAITGTPTGPNGTASFTIKVTDGSNPVQSATQALSIVINLPPAPAITTTSLPGVVEFASYNQTVAATGYAPLVYSVSAGTLPAGLSLNSSTGAITGAPTGPNGTANFTVQVADHSNPVQSTTQPLSIAVSLPPAPAITTTTLPNGTVGTAYSQTIGFSGGHTPFTWSISVGSLPAGLNINTSTGAITGTPTAQGTSNFTVKVVDSSNPTQSATQALSISVITAPLGVTTATLPTGAVNDVYPATNLVSTGGLPPNTWSITVGALPAGLSLSTAGQITGTPTASGTFNFTAQVKDSTNATATGNFSIIVNPVLAVSTSTLPGGTQGTSYTTTNLAATGGVTPYSWSVSSGSLPSGLTLSNSGQLSGLPTVSGTFNFTVKVTDASSGTATANLSITLAAAPPLAVTTSGSLPQGTLNTVYPSTNLNASGGIQPYTWIVVTPGTGPLPPGLTLSSSGQITGTPTAAGTYPFTVQVTDSISGTATANLSITVSAAAVTCDTTLTGKESLLHGDYAFVLSGFDSTGNPALVGGVFVASGVAGTGNITSGTLDMNLDVTNGVTTNSLISGSTYNLGQDTNGGYRGCMAFTTSAGTQHYAFSVDSISGTPSVASDGHMIDFDTTGPFTAGILRLANSAAFSTNSITGSWAFGISGPKPSSNGGGKFAAAGVLTFSSGSVSGVADTNDNGQLDNSSTLTGFPAGAAGTALTAGSYSIGSNGRGTMTFTPGGSSSSVNSFVYVVSASEALVLNADSQTNNTAFIGRAFKQSGTFSNSSLTGNHVIYASGISGTTGASRTEIDLVSTSGTTFSFSGYQNDAGTISDPTNNSGSGTFSVASNGRVVLTCSACGNHLPIFYLSSANTAFFLNSDNSVSFGSFEPQTGSPFTASSASGTYGIGLIYPEVPGISVQSGDVTFTPSTTSISGIFDDNSQGTLTPGSSQTQTYSINSTGVGLLPSGCTLTGSGGNCDTLLVVISPTKLVAMSAKPSNGTQNHTTPQINVVQK